MKTDKEKPGTGGLKKDRENTQSQRGKQTKLQTWPVSLVWSHTCNFFPCSVQCTPNPNCHHFEPSTLVKLLPTLSAFTQERQWPTHERGHSPLLIKTLFLLALGHFLWYNLRLPYCQHTSFHSATHARTHTHTNNILCATHCNFKGTYTLHKAR